MKNFFCMIFVVLTLSACTVPKEPDYSEFSARESALRQLKAPQGKAILYVINANEVLSGKLQMYSGIKTTLGFIYGNKFNAYCLKPGEYSLIYNIGFFDSDPLPLHLEANKVYGILVGAGDVSIFHGPPIRALSYEETEHFVSQRQLGPDPRFSPRDERQSPFRCDFSLIAK